MGVGGRKGTRAEPSVQVGGGKGGVGGELSVQVSWGGVSVARWMGEVRGGEGGGKAMGENCQSM